MVSRSNTSLPCLAKYPPDHANPGPLVLVEVLAGTGSVGHGLKVCKA